MEVQGCAAPRGATRRLIRGFPTATWAPLQRKFFSNLLVKPQFSLKRPSPVIFPHRSTGGYSAGRQIDAFRGTTVRFPAWASFPSVYCRRRAKGNRPGIEPGTQPSQGCAYTTRRLRCMALPAQGALKNRKRSMRPEKKHHLFEKNVAFKIF